MGNNGGRANRSGGLGLNGTAKTTAPRVSATAWRSVTCELLWNGQSFCF
jgi:hypothetical protein